MTKPSCVKKGGETQSAGERLPPLMLEWQRITHSSGWPEEAQRLIDDILSALLAFVDPHEKIDGKWVRAAQSVDGARDVECPFWNEPMHEVSKCSICSVPRGLHGLVKRWRKEASEYPDRRLTTPTVMRICADELEQALARQEKK